jgi:hypothetical protein
MKVVRWVEYTQDFLCPSLLHISRPKTKMNDLVMLAMTNDLNCYNTIDFLNVHIQPVCGVSCHNITSMLAQSKERINLVFKSVGTLHRLKRRETVHWDWDNRAYGHEDDTSASGCGYTSVLFNGSFFHIFDSPLGIQTNT